MHSWVLVTKWLWCALGNLGYTCHFQITQREECDLAQSRSNVSNWGLQFRRKALWSLKELSQKHILVWFLGTKILIKSCWRVRVLGLAHCNGHIRWYALNFLSQFFPFGIFVFAKFLCVAHWVFHVIPLFLDGSMRPRIGNI